MSIPRFSSRNTQVSAACVVTAVGRRLDGRAYANRTVRRHVRSAPRRPPGDSGQRASCSSARLRRFDGRSSPWQKDGTRPITPAEDRLAMVEAAVADVKGLVAGDAEIRRGGPSFTADTLAGMAECDPGAELFTIVGDDAAAGLTTWQRYDEVVALSRLVVVDRPGAPVELPPGFDWLHVEVPRLEVSSTDLRARVLDGRPLDYLVTEPVLEIIALRNLYRDAV